MKKRVIVTLGAAALVIAMQITAFAAVNGNTVTKTTLAAQTQVRQYGCGGVGSAGYGLMMDENGNLLNREDFSKKLEDGVKDGTVKAEDKEYYLDMYERCTQKSGGGMMRGGCY